MNNRINLYALIPIFVFIFSCGLSARISSPMLESFFEVPIAESDLHYAKVVAISTNNVYATPLDEIESFKSQHEEFSFLIPTAEESKITRKLNQTVERTTSQKNTIHLKITDISETEQIIEYTVERSKSSTTFKYRASKSVILPVSIKHLNLIWAFWGGFFGLIGGIIGLAIFRIVFRKPIDRYDGII